MRAGVDDAVMDNATSPPDPSLDRAIVVDDAFAMRLAAGSLRNTLRLNALLSASTGLLALAAGPWLADTLGTGHVGIVRLLGAGLVLFAAALAVAAASRASTMHRWALGFSVADLAWTATSLLTIALGWFAAAGNVAVALTATAVCALGVRQLQLWRRLSLIARPGLSGIDEHPPVEVFHFEVEVPVAATTAWDVITDHRLYGQLAPNLSSAHVDGDTAEGTVRTCANRSGRQWSETCTRWDEGERFEFNVHTDDYPYPLAVMRGAWWVRAVAPRASLVGMDFRYQPRSGVRGAVFAAAMQAAFPLVLRRILRGWRAEMLRQSTTAPHG